MSYLSEPESSELKRDAMGDIREADQKVCPTLLIEDTPAEDDLLASHGGIGPHERVAQAIAEVIRSPNESGGKMIGLEGGWGAGKTTIINLLQKELASNDSITVFSFDAWAHEGDPLRRTYLESLIGHFQCKEWIDKTKWDKELEKLANRRRVSSTRTVPKTTTLGTVFAISVLLVPVGIPFLLTSLQHGIQGPWRCWMFVMLVIGSLFSVAPGFVIAGNWARIWYKRRREKRDGGKSFDKSKDDDQELSDWAFLTGNAITETKQDTTETPEPTSIEFEKYFRELMEKALPNKCNRQAIIVLDNLDRVDPKDARSIWATLQTFLQNPSEREKQWFNKIWIIVPYDPTGLRQLWENRGAADTAPDKKESGSTGRENDGEQIVSDSFIDKSFQLRFEVPPPILSNWKVYLTKLVARALPEHSEADRETIYHVFNLCRDKDGEAPTPRELKLYVNQIGVIHRQWQHEFPIGHVAYYVILRRKHTNIRGGLLSGQLPPLNIESILPLNLGANLAGLTFNVQARLGQQLLLGGPIHTALIEPDPEKLKELKERHDDGFWAVLEEDALSWPALIHARTVANIALCLQQSKIIEDSKRSEINRVIQSLSQAASRVPGWVNFNEHLANGIVAILHVVSDIDLSKEIVASLRQTIGALTSQQETPAVTEEIVAGLINICKKINDLSHQDVLDTPFTLPVDAQGWVEVCSYIGTRGLEFSSLFEPRATFDEISELLCTAVMNGQFDDKHLVAVQVTQESPISCNWDSLAAVFEQRLNVEQNPNSNEAKFLLNGLSFLRQYRCTNAQAASARLANDGHLMHHLHQAELHKDVDLKTWCIVTFLEQQPQAIQPQNVGNSTAGHSILTNSLNTDDLDLATRVVGLLHDQSNLDLLFKVAEARNSYDPLIIRSLRIVADSETSEVLYTPAALIKRWSYLRQYLDEDETASRFDKLIGHLCEKSSLVEEVQQAEGGFNHENAGLYLAICKASSLKAFREWCRVGLEDLAAGTWESELANEGDSLELLLILMDAGISVALRQPYQDALVNHAKGLLVERVTLSSKLVSQRSKILAGLGTEDQRTLLRRRLCDAAMDRDGQCANDFFEMYGDEIADRKTITADSSIVVKLFSPLVRERNTGGLRWLSTVFSNNPNILDQYTDTNSVQDFRERLQVEVGKSTDEADEAHKLIVEIANILGIKREEEPLKDEHASDGDSPEDNGSEEGNSNEE